jgi:hypothetical protein
VNAGSHPINLAVRFLLELCALAASGYWGWTTHRGPLRYLLALGLPLLLTILWGTFAVPDDPSRSGRAPLPVPGFVRLALELTVFAFAAWALYDADRPALGLILAAVVVIHYALSYDRIAWLLRR